MQKNDNGAKANRKGSCYQKKRDTLVNVKIKLKWTDNEIKEQRNKTPCKEMIMVQRRTEKEVVTRRKGTPW